MEQIWWEQVSNASCFVSDIASDLLEEKSLILQHAGDIPWYSVMVRRIKDEVSRDNSYKRFEEIRGAEDPGAYILKEFCKPEKRAAYRPAISYAKFLADSDDIVLHDRYLWVKTDTPETLEAWMKFAVEYDQERDADKGRAAFILEYQAEDSINRKRGIGYFSFDEYISEYDCIVFAALMSSSVRFGSVSAAASNFYKDYLTELSANVIGNDIELGAECIRRYKDFLADPFKTITEITERENRSDGRPFVYVPDQQETDRRIWRAQIKAVYPVIEEFREAFIEKHSDAIKAGLPIPASSFTDELCEKPEDAELGTLVFMRSTGRLDLEFDEYDLLKKYKSARDKLSHIKALTFDEIRQLVY